MTKIEPFPFQEADLKKLERAGWVGLLNMQTGTGKTYVSCWAIQRSGAQVTLVVAPQGTHETAWIPTVTDVLGEPPRVIGNGRKAHKEAYTDFLLGYPGVYLATPQWVTRTDTGAWMGDFLVIDEAHGLSNPGSKGQKVLGGYTPRQAAESLASRFPRRLALSGTALRNKFELAWGHSRFLWPEYSEAGEIGDQNFYRWQMERMDFREIYTNQRDQWGNAKKVKEFYGEKDPGSWVRQAPCVISHVKRGECCEYAPNGHLSTQEPTERHLTINLLPEQKKAVRELEAMAVTYLEENPLVADLPLTKATRIRQMALGVPTIRYLDDEVESVEFSDDCKSPYLDTVKDMLENAYDDEPVIIYTDSQKFASVVTKRLQSAGITAFEYSGATRKDRDENLAQFGKNYRVCVAVLAAIAEGVDSIQRVCKTEFWLSSSLDETLNEQARGRTDRMGQTGQVERVYLHDDLGLSENRFSEALTKRIELNRSLKAA